MKRRLVFLLILATVLFIAAAAFCQEPRKISKEDLKAMIGNPDLIILDVRIGLEWKDSDKKIRGAVREDPEQIRSWIRKYPKDKTIALYCS